MAGEVVYEVFAAALFKCHVSADDDKPLFHVVFYGY